MFKQRFETTLIGGLRILLLAIAFVACGALGETGSPFSTPSEYVLEGEGDGEHRVKLNEGRWIVNARVRDNLFCGYGDCVPGVFRVHVGSASPGLRPPPFTLDPQQGVEKWNGADDFEVGRRLKDVPPGEAVVRVTAYGSYRIKLHKNPD